MKVAHRLIYFTLDEEETTTIRKVTEILNKMLDELQNEYPKNFIVRDSDGVDSTVTTDVPLIKALDFLQTIV